jgi:peptide/nickel transport system ATP-binding protein
VPPVLSVTDFVVHRDAAWSIGLPRLELAAGDVAALFGPSGGGKTTLLAGLFGLLGPAWQCGGSVSFGGRDVNSLAAAELRQLRRSSMAFLLQDAQAALDPLQPVGAQIAAVTPCRADDAVAMLERLGVDDAAALCRRLPHEISGGQAQRVLLAIAFLRAPALVVADEPTASLDGGSYTELVRQLQALRAQGSALLLATHDQRLVRDLGASLQALHGDRFVPGAPVPAAWPACPPAPGGCDEVLVARGLRVAHGRRKVLDGVDFTLHRGEVVAVVGESGAGKTTLARVLARHQAPDAGEVLWPLRPTAVQLCGQDAFAALTPGRTVRSLLAEARAPSFDVDRTAAGLRLPREVLDRVAAQLSGGERRRAALLRALAVQPDVLLLDEQTAALDRATATAVLESLLSLQASRGMAMVVVTHELDLAHAIAHRVLEVQGGRLCRV